MNRSLFGSIDLLLRKYGKKYALPEGNRYVSLNKDEREQTFAASAKEVVAFEGLNTTCILVKEAEKKNVWLITGPSFSLTTNKELRRASPGELLYFYTRFKPRLIVDPLICYDVASLAPIDDYAGHDPSLLFSCFQSVFAYEEPDPAICRSRQLTLALLDPSRIDEDVDQSLVRAISSLDYISCVYERMNLRSVLYVGTKKGFLEIYNGIESIYFRIFCRELYRSSKVTVDENTFYGGIENVIGWRPREIDALKKILTLIHSSSAENFREVARLVKIDNLDSIDSLANELYKFRNNCVHWRTKTPESISKTELIRMTIACLKVLSFMPGDLFDKQNVCDCSKSVDIY
ncbi:hypothetical protein NKH98_29895 [Mesorhizobium sp. M0833]|uniref:hypothetical protein n=1 Tax=Mesorhizobium sp. M0833 TaxID=2957009 RepID=UPI00333A18F9